ncbi:hypothetical protein KKE48_01895 [Patescibacteria group bacterium]|nr:hypothetical protein [Patescibacteria group bacterium]MBU1499601.1 hypothetical protein [Patescibacteria group bacterium]
MSDTSTFFEISVRDCEGGSHHPEQERSENAWHIIPFSEDRPVLILTETAPIDENVVDKVLFSQTLTTNGPRLGIDSYGFTEVFVGEKPLISRDYTTAIDLAPGVIGRLKVQELKPKGAFVLFYQPQPGAEVVFTIKANRKPVKEVKVVSKQEA